MRKVPIGIGIFLFQHAFSPKEVSTIAINTIVVKSVERYVRGAKTLAQKAKTFKILSGFMDTSLIYDLSSDVVNRTILLSKNHKIKLPDAIIAATALTLMTRNVSDFKNIAELQIVNPYDM